MGNEQNTGGRDAQCACHHKATPRSEEELRLLKNRLSRMAGQLSGIGKMLDDNRYCGDILTQIAAVESALQSFGYLILQDHMKTCVVEEIRKGNTGIVDEAVELVKKLK
ncbi:metal-sensing transcriptional repressor [Christensenella tenuis]|jgi:CsoR family transcriptional regulator, copper-sensing transcriptional repressor|uniref:Metal-sensing transcriptional repressor n=1 Tax=Christensenella tenuis TaxID=2763033 RepID=A0ABR7EGR3_9FIRM|nr:metal-sensing transcriptional repressor [Christensenella tenuis]MBC5648358.1 metal-sensing transcriptional repressor [Christensenella tenuis]